MPLHPGEPPPTALEVVRRAVEHRAVTATFTTGNLMSAQPETLALSTPHRVAFLALDHMRPKCDLNKLVHWVGWRFLIHGPDKSIAAIRASPKKEGGYELGEITEGPFVSGTEEAIERAESLDDVRNGDYEAILLFAPEVYVVALWLRDRVCHNDIFLALPGSNPKFVPFKPMALDEFLEVLCDRAEKVRCGASGR
jgi:hypothetical protein